VKKSTSASHVGLSGHPDVELPQAVQRLTDEHPQVWAAYQQLGAEVNRAGPLDERNRRLVNLALAIGAGSQGATHSHARRALAEGLTEAELEHVAFLAITTLGWPQAVKGLTWIRDITKTEALVKDD